MDNNDDSLKYALLQIIQMFSFSVCVVMNFNLFSALVFNKIQFIIDNYFSSIVLAIYVFFHVVCISVYYIIKNVNNE